MELEQKIRRVLDNHVDRKLTKKRANAIVKALVRTLGVKTIKKRSKVCVVAAHDGSGRVMPTEVQPRPRGEADSPDQIVIGHPDADE
jgi:hypothetical protein